MIRLIFACSFFSLLLACSPVKVKQSNNYTLSSASKQKLSAKTSHQSILVTQPTAAAGFQTNQMIYMRQPYLLNSFTNNQWIAPPADMLLPVIRESLQNSGYFYAVVSMPFSGKTSLRLDTNITVLQQNFFTLPSEIVMGLNATLVDNLREHVIASKRFKVVLAAPKNNPYGGVVAANQATQRIMHDLAAFVVEGAKRAK